MSDPKIAYHMQLYILRIIEVVPLFLSIEVNIVRLSDVEFFMADHYTFIYKELYI